MPRRFDRKTGWNRQFKWKPLRRDRWDPFPKDHLPFIDDFSVGAFIAKSVAAANMDPGTKRKRDVMETRKRKFERERADIDTARKQPSAKRARTGSNVTRSLFTNDSVATMSAIGAGAAGMAYTGAGIAADRLNARIASGIEEGFAANRAAQETGFIYDALTESAMAGRYLTNMAEGMGRIVPLVEDLLEIGLLV